MKSNSSKPRQKFSVHNYEQRKPFKKKPKQAKYAHLNPYTTVTVKQFKIYDGTVLTDSGGLHTASMLMQNAYVGASNNNYYTANSWACQIMMTTQDIYFNTAGSGTANVSSAAMGTATESDIMIIPSVHTEMSLEHMLLYQ